VPSQRTRVLIVRGHLATPWELVPWSRLPERFEVSYLVTRSNAFDTSALQLRPVRVRALRDLLPRGVVGELVAGVTGDRYMTADAAYAQADIVHAEELGFWFAADAARHKSEHGYRLVQTVWETIPLMSAYRNRQARGFRRHVLEATDLFLPATERARNALLLEGVPPERLLVAPPGIDLDRFAGAEAEQPAEHVIVSPGRLVWEKGHQDVLRAVAALRGGLVPGGEQKSVRVLLVGSGPEEERLRAHAAELGLADRLEIRSVGYDEMPRVFAQASCLVLASLPAAGSGYHPFGVPRAFWEEQFGYVLAEGMAAGLPVLAADSGAIREVVGDSGVFFQPGDWMGLARALAEGPLARPPGERFEHPAELLRRYSIPAAAERLARAYDRVLAQAS
jgi:glycosyltransferase involved in cell wall biosynthesis